MSGLIAADAAPFATFKGRAERLAFEERPRGVWIFLKGQRFVYTGDDYRKFDSFTVLRGSMKDRGVAVASGRIV